MSALHGTKKFAVWDPPGVTQPEIVEEVAEVEASASSSKKGGSSGAQGTRLTKSTASTMSTASSKKIGGPFTKTKNPAWLKERSSIFDEVKKLRDAENESKPRQPITVTMPDGTVKDKLKDGSPILSYQNSPYDVAVSISQGLADAAVVARVWYAERLAWDPAAEGAEGSDGLQEAMDELEVKEVGEKPELWDMTRPLVGTVKKLEFVKFAEEKDGMTVFWHSSAHILGEAIEHLYGGYLTIGPPVSSGFYYDCYLGDGSVSEEDYKVLEKEVTSAIVKKKQKFERLVVTKEEAMQMFKYNPFKIEILRTKVANNTRTTVYRCGDLIDLCRGPHVRHTGMVKSFSCTNHSATQWLAKDGNDQLQRVYGVSFPDKKMMTIWKENREKAKARDHRVIGVKQGLFMFHELSPGSCFFLPPGARIYNKLIDFIKQEYWKRGYDEVVTPNVFNLDLWRKSGHYMHYKDGMFIFDVEGQEWGMKPMNCPGHCLIFGSTTRSWRDLPMRFADFGVLHRNELSGALTGLTRVRRFQQDDAHIYCRQDQIEEEVLGALDFMKYVYDIFGMSYKLELSTRPAKALGEIDVWNKAEAALASAMDKFAGKGNWRENPGDGAFYGPKIDIKVSDSMDRVHQCATIQLDFQLPIRFDLKYKSNVSVKEGGGEAKKEREANDAKEGFERPVMVHRAMLGSVERMFAVLTEHYGGKWPLWLSPRQVMLVPVHSDQFEYGESIRAQLHDLGFFAECDTSKATFQKKVRNAQVDQWNYQLVIGKAEMANGTVNIRTRENEVKGEMKVDEFLAMLQRGREEHK
ncbi:hypothetical protein TrLO_g5627 [Triparma laevis f. longispina]|uniref:Probable threonine--tRNA ligase, cytoplasmic n=1 Tax=Triparma laevis f. longispina TaxID=1714387 RepID=A0A9W7F9R7_9STRA|nr:hypothetical protein TrLO_g5627 [Triparma laevis f. longispina]